ncbi:SRPBCC domain-containing protein [Arthrobacter sp. ATA002]|uniref:SRPBCC domain-containing protein n=1 Tax=Arthrobacter sp. ATA002 TaxID=2991715 RepID=UPI0022A7557B|nr:SRPBCC domain-containing protein [Arthrobacter sp. ATA002]WAP50878.1 SRPBCC domain-containing protein [Arthrobacter sp. ATA002]
MPLTSRSLSASREAVHLIWLLPVSPARVWWGLTDPAALPQWIGTVTSGEFAAGSAVTVQHAENYSCISTVLDCTPEALLAMTWEFPDEPLSHLRITLTPDGTFTRLDLTHEGLGAETANYLTGWHTHLLYLEDLLRGCPRPMAEFWPTYEGIASHLS